MPGPKNHHKDRRFGSPSVPFLEVIDVPVRLHIRLGIALVYRQRFLITHCPQDGTVFARHPPHLHRPRPRITVRNHGRPCIPPVGEARVPFNFFWWRYGGGIREMMETASACHLIYHRKKCSRRVDPIQKFN